MVSRNTTLVTSLGLRIGPACEAVAWGGHTPLPLLAAWLAAWLNPDWIGQWAVRRRHGF